MRRRRVKSLRPARDLVVARYWPEPKEQQVEPVLEEPVRHTRWGLGVRNTQTSRETEAWRDTWEGGRCRARRCWKNYRASQHR